MKIVYIGAKSQKSDNVAGTGLTWTRGEIHEVEDEKKIELLLAHKTVWANADEKYQLAPELTIVQNEAESTGEVIMKNEAGLTGDYVMKLPHEMIKALHIGDLIPIFLTLEENDAFEMWKLEQYERKLSTAPKNTGPQIEVNKQRRPKFHDQEKKAS